MIPGSATLAMQTVFTMRSATVSGATNGDSLTLVGGTLAPGGLAARVNWLGDILEAGSYILFPKSPAATTGGTLGATVTPHWSTALKTTSTFDPLNTNVNIVLSNGNLTASGTSGTPYASKATLYKSSGTWTAIYSIGVANAGIVGIMNTSAPTSTYVGSDANGYGYVYGGNKQHGGIGVPYGASYTSGDVITMIFNGTIGTLEFLKNGTSQGVAFTGITGSWVPAVSIDGVGQITGSFSSWYLWSPVSP